MSAQIGHNGGPPLASTAWKAHCWRQARADLLPVLPVEVVRNRVRRARELGLDYKTYAGVRATTGRDIVAFLFSSNALGVFRDRDALASGRAEKLTALQDEKHLGAGPGIDPAALGAMIDAKTVQRLPVFGSSWTEMQSRLKSWLRQVSLPGDAVLMIGETDHEREIMTAGGLAGFVEGNRFFMGATHAT